ncbi:hypothetical protein BOTCAL_0162g00140 [Botryotinia calthae]|uniref:Uncharacterized protein n=1 Tax=Botryotinia calthae TaxID=38488 RepID=A0A4Y8D4B0_9HELO|nr:hypothetical protein BOTCAL_0162g00140 [Botryotinia calthae]
MLVGVDSRSDERSFVSRSGSGFNLPTAKRSPCATYSTVAGTEACFRSNDTAPPSLNIFWLPFLPILEEEMSRQTDKRKWTNKKSPIPRVISSNLYPKR